MIADDQTCDKNLQTTVISIPEVETIILCTNYSLSILRKEVTIRSTLFTTTNYKSFYLVCNYKSKTYKHKQEWK